MATRSYHIMLTDDKKALIMQYIHWDGYPSRRLPILINHYNTPDKVKELFSHGAASGLSIDGSVSNPYGEPNRVVPLIVDSDKYIKVIAKMMGINAMPLEDFHYFWDGKRWWLMEDLGLVDRYLNGGKIDD